MKKTAKLLSLVVALFAGLSGTAQAEGFKIGADIVSSYVWRGSDISDYNNGRGDSPAIQPALSYTCPDTGIVIGAWGSYAISESNGINRYKETDLYVTVPAGPFSLTVTDYYTVTNDSRAFDFSSDGPNTLEISGSYAKDNLSLLAAINVAGNDYDNAKYFEAGYKFYDKDKYTAKAFVGAGDELQYAPGQGTGFNVVNVGITVTKESYSASYVYNPDTEKSNLVFMASF
ncbi:MAG: hypothetical protein FDX21_08615 [Chlorobium sp.]|nr:MAG: hypothetical protein FDX21_08615 [Chlorobium sp.]